MINIMRIETLLLPNQAASMLLVDVETLNVWRCTKRYKLPYVRIGRSIRYRLKDIEEFIENNIVK